MTFYFNEMHNSSGDLRGRDRMVIGFTIIYAISANHSHGEVYSIQHYVIQFVNDLRQVDSFLHVLQFPPSIKVTVMM